MFVFGMRQLSGGTEECEPERQMKSNASKEGLKSPHVMTRMLVHSSPHMTRFQYTAIGEKCLALPFARVG